MRKWWWNVLRPSALKNQLFLAFLFLILIPYSVLQIRNFMQIENLYERKISEQNQYQLQQVASSFEDLKSLVFRTTIQLEREESLSEVLNVPDPGGKSDDRKLVEQLFKGIKENFLPQSSNVHYAISDFKGTLYTSYPNSDSDAYRQFMNQEGVKQALGGGHSYRWTLETDTIHFDIGKSPGMLTLYSVIPRKSGKPAGILRVSIDYQAWLRSSVSGFLVQQDYMLIDGNHEILASSRPNLQLPPGTVSHIGAELVPGRYFLDSNSSSLLNISHISSMNWDLLGQFWLAIYFGDIAQIKHQYFFSFAAITLIFILATFFISSTITRPLQILQKRMSEMVQKNFRVFLSPDLYRGEMLQLVNAFNRMVGETNELINRLKAEERQKEALRFQMLLSQMNPHFLLNTLNTIKWNALSRQDEATAEICVGLGRLLETGLNVDVDLIPLKDEMELVESYVYIQNFRFDQKFTVYYDYEPILKYALVPKLSLQPLVENAIYHGFARIKHGGEIHIRIRAEGQQLIVEVEDNGSGPAQAAQNTAGRKRKGIGMKNIRERLQLLFKDKASLELIPQERGALALMKLPMLSSPPFVGNDNQLN